MKPMKVGAVASALGIVGLLLGAGNAPCADGTAALRIGARATSATPKEILERYQPLADHLAARLKRPVELRPATSYPEILDRLKSGDFDAAILGSSAGARAVRDLDAIPVARPEKGGVSGYRGYIVVRKDGGARSIADLKGKSFDYVEKGASAGWIFPRALLAGKKLDPDAFFSRASFAGRHDIAVMKVLNRETDAASVKDTEFAKLSRSDPRVDAELRVIRKSALFPDSTILFRKGTPPETLKAVRLILLGLEKDPGGRAILAARGIDRYIDTERKDFDELLKIMALVRE